MDTHTVLCRARNLLDRDGWSGDPYGKRCATHACYDAASSGAGIEASLVLAHHLGARDLGAVWRWNDAPGRTKAEVLGLFDRAIAATAPEPDLASLNLNENGGAKDWNALEARVRG